MEKGLSELFSGAFGAPPAVCEALRAHASERKIFRLRAGDRSVIGVVNANRAENTAFIEFSRHFRNSGLPVPEIYASDLDRHMYLEEDLGDTTLYDELQRARSGNEEAFPPAIEALYEKAVETLPRFQIAAGRTLPYRHCVKTRAFSADSILWDMRFFRDSFLARANVAHDQAALEQDFGSFTNYLLEERQEDAAGPFFMYRDFQSRNIMARSGSLWFIDYQGGRQGPLEYDVASLLYQSRANVPRAARERLLVRYLDAAAEISDVDRARFMKFFPSFVLVRMMQVLGTYAKQGLADGKDYFAGSIPFAKRNVEILLSEGALPSGMPELSRVLKEVGGS